MRRRRARPGGRGRVPAAGGRRRGGRGGRVCRRSACSRPHPPRCCVRCPDAAFANDPCPIGRRCTDLGGRRADTPRRDARPRAVACGGEAPRRHGDNASGRPGCRAGPTHRRRGGTRGPAVTGTADPRRRPPRRGRQVHRERRRRCRGDASRRPHTGSGLDAARAGIRVALSHPRATTPSRGWPACCRRRSWRAFSRPFPGPDVRGVEPRSCARGPGRLAGDAGAHGARARGRPHGGARPRAAHAAGHRGVGGRTRRRHHGDRVCGGSGRAW